MDNNSTTIQSQVFDIKTIQLRLKVITSSAGIIDVICRRRASLLLTIMKSCVNVIELIITGSLKCLKLQRNQDATAPSRNIFNAVIVLIESFLLLWVDSIHSSTRLNPIRLCTLYNPFRKKNRDPEREREKREKERERNQIKITGHVFTANQNTSTVSLSLSVSHYFVQLCRRVWRSTHSTPVLTFVI